MCRVSGLVFRCAVASLYEVVSVRPSVGPSVRQSVHPALFSKVKSTRTRRILYRVSGLVLTFLVCLLSFQLAISAGHIVSDHHPITLCEWNLSLEINDCVTLTDHGRSGSQDNYLAIRGSISITMFSS